MGEKLVLEDDWAASCTWSCCLEDDRTMWKVESSLLKGLGGEGDGWMDGWMGECAAHFSSRKL